MSVCVSVCLCVCHCVIIGIQGVPVSGRAYNHLLSAYSNRDSNEEFFRVSRLLSSLSWLHLAIVPAL